MKKRLFCILICMLTISITFVSVSGTIISEKNPCLLSNGNILYVGGSGLGNYSTIQEAIEASVAGDTVFVFDDLIKKFSLPMPNHLKIDVDGIERIILEGATETLRNPSVKSIILELNEVVGERNGIQDFLEQFGFQIHSKGESRLLNTSTIMYNCIFHKQNYSIGNMYSNIGCNSYTDSAYRISK